jgi:hypothetical protein
VGVWIGFGECPDLEGFGIQGFGFRVKCQGFISTQVLGLKSYLSQDNVKFVRPRT